MSPAGIVLRDAHPDDAFEVATVHVRSWQSAYRGIVPGAYLDSMRPEDRMARYTFADTRPGQPRTIVALDGGTIIGFATYGPCRDEDAPDHGEVYAIYLDPSAWGRGGGRVLMEETRLRLAGDGFADAALWALVGNDRAAAFYQRDGWCRDGTRKNFEIGGAWVDEERFRRSLADPARVPPAGR